MAEGWVEAAISLFGVRDFIVSALVLVPLERIAALRPSQGTFRAGWPTDVAYHLLNKVIVGLAVSGLAVVMRALSDARMPPEWRVHISEAPLGLQVAAAVLLADLGFYTLHRAFHEIPALWRFHVVHHGIEEMDWLAAARVHAFDQVLTKGGSLLPLLVLPFSPTALGIFAFVYTWHTLLLHANLRFDLGPLGRFVATPRFHHWHHARDPRAHDRNYAAQLAVIDLAFGTLYLPDRGFPEQYGVDERVPRGFWAQLQHPLRRAPADHSP
jgi:sterol desaturase/sphingolipid hydroxylase (fatty acid hydroxylase superfamily)